MSCEKFVSQRNIAVFFRRVRVAFILKQRNGPDEFWTREFWLNDLIYVTAFGRNIWISKLIFKLSDLCFSKGLVMFCYLSLEQNAHGSFGPHDCNFCGRIGEINVRADMFRRHHAIGSAVSFSRNYRYFGHGRLGECVQKLRSMANYSQMFLIYTRQKSRDILECDQRDVETITKTHETRRFNRCVDVQNARKKSRLVGNYPNRITAQTGKPNHDIWCVMLLHLKKITFIDNVMNDIPNVIGLSRGLRNHRI